MKIWIAVLLVIFLVPMIVVSAGNANHSDHENQSTEKGTITFTQTGTVTSATERGEHNTITLVKETLDFTGNLTGSAQTLERLAKHNDTDDANGATFATFHGSGNFTGKLNGASVTLHIRYEGISNDTFTRGNFVVSGDTSQNADVHGEGHFSGHLTTGEAGTSAVNYAMHSHVASHNDHPEANDQDKRDN